MTKEKMRKGNIAIEYAALIIILVSALLLMQTYIVRGFSGRWRSVGDAFGFGRQYEPGVTQVTETIP
jgi:Flp pilus assembly pilin Flp